MTISYDPQGNPLPLYDLPIDTSSQLPATPLAGLFGSSVDPTAVPDPLSQDLSAVGSTDVPTASTPFGPLTGSSSVAPPNMNFSRVPPPPPPAPGTNNLTGNELVNQLFSPQAAQTGTGVAAQGSNDLVNQLFANSAPPQLQQGQQGQGQLDPNSAMGRAIDWEKKNLPSWAQTGVNSALESIGPGAVGLIGAGFGGAAVGAGVGALAGLGVADAITVPLGIVGGFVGGMLGMFGAQSLASTAQGAGLKAVMGDQQYSAYTQMRAQQDKASPVAALVGQFIGMGAFMGPNLKELTLAAKLAGDFSRSGDIAVFGAEKNKEALDALVAVGMGSGTQAGLTALQQIRDGNFDPAMLASSALLGGLMNHNTKLGEQLTGMGEHILPEALRRQVNNNVEVAKSTASSTTGDAHAASPADIAATQAANDVAKQKFEAAKVAFTEAQKTGDKDIIKKAGLVLGNAQGDLIHSQVMLHGGALDASQAAPVVPSVAPVEPVQGTLPLEEAQAKRAVENATPAPPQVPHAVENGTTTLKANEFYHAVPNTSQAVNDRVFGNQDDPTSLNLTRDPATAIQHFNATQGTDPGLVIVKLKKGHSALGDGPEVTAQPSDVSTVRHYRNASGGRTPTDEGSQLSPQLPVAHAAVAQSHDAIFDRSKQADESGMHVQAIPVSTDNLKALDGELHGPVASAHGGLNGGGNDLLALNYMGSALRDAKLGSDLLVARDLNGNLGAAVSYRVTPEGQESFLGPTLQIQSLGSVMPHAGTRLLAEVARTAVSHGLGLEIFSHPEAKGYYESLGLKELDKQFYGLTAEEAAKMVRALDEVTNRDGTVREAPRAVLDERVFNKPLVDKMMERAVKLGATEMPGAEVHYGWMFPDGRGLNIPEKMVHDDIFGHPDLSSLTGANGRPLPLFGAFMKEGAVRVASTTRDIAYQHGVLTNTAIDRIEANLISKSGPSSQVRDVQLLSNERGDLPPADTGDHYFTTEDFRRNDFNLQATIKEADAVNARLANNRLENAVRDGSIDALKKALAPEPIIAKMAKKVMPDGEVRAVAGMDPRMMGVLGGNLYNKPLDLVAVKESLQNAIDAVRSSDSSKIELSYNDARWEQAPPFVDGVYVGNDGPVRVGPSITIKDNGHGMTTATALKQFVDLGGSLKEEGSSGGFGIAKIALFSNAEKIRVQTVAIDPATGKRILTELTGSGADWMDPERGLKVVTHEMYDDSPTGTDVRLALKESVNSDSYQVKDFMQNFSMYNRLPVELDFKWNGDTIGEGYDAKPKPDLSRDRTLSIAGGKVDVYSSTTTMKTDGGGHTATVLNNGIFQFKMYFSGGKGIELPTHVVFDVHSAAGPEEGDYPFRPDREGLRADAEDKIQEYLKDTLIADALRKQGDQIHAAFENAPTLKGTDYRVVDLSGQIPDDVVKDITQQPYLVDLMHSLRNSLNEMKVGGGYEMKDARFDGISLDNDSLGVNIKGSAIGRQTDGYDKGNAILLNPFVIHNEILQEFEGNRSLRRDPAAGYRAPDLGDKDAWMAKNVAARMMSTIVHEMGHETFRNHDEGFSGKLTRLMDQTLESKYAGIMQIAELLKENGYERLHQLDETASNLAGRMGSNQIFKHAGVGFTAPRQQPRGDQGSVDNGQVGGAGLATHVWYGDRVPTEPLASGTDRSTSNAERGIGENHGIQSQATNRAEEAGRSGQGSKGFQALEARAFGYSGKAAQGPSFDGVNGDRASTDVAGSQAAHEAGSAQGDQVANGNTPGSGGVVGSGGIGDRSATTGTDGFGRATTDAGRGSTDAGRTGFGSTTDDGRGTATTGRPTDGSTASGRATDASGNGSSGIESRDSGRAATDGSSDGAPGARAGGLRPASAQRDDATGTADLQAGASSTGNSPADAGRAPYAQLSAEAGAARRTALDHPITFTGLPDGLRGSEADMLARINTAGLNDTGLVHEINVNSDLFRNSSILGVYNPKYRHSVEVDPEGILRPEARQIYLTNLRGEVGTIFDLLPVGIPRENLDFAKAELLRTIDRVASASDADRLFSVIGHELIHPKLMEARTRMREEALKSDGVVPKNYKIDPKTYSGADYILDQARYYPQELLDNMAKMGLKRQVELLVSFRDFVLDKLAGKSLTATWDEKGGAFDLATQWGKLKGEGQPDKLTDELEKASYDIEEHVNYLVMGARGVGVHDYSEATNATYGHSVWNPAGRREGQGFADQWLRANEAPASEAPYLRSSDPPELDRRAALAAQRDYYATRSAADWGGDRPAANQGSGVGLLAGVQHGFGEKLIGESKPEFEERRTLTLRTSEAAALTRRPGETDAAFGERVAVKANYASVEHVNRIIDAANGGEIPTEVRGGKTYIKLGTEEYKGTPKELVKGMSSAFRKIMGGAKTKAVDEMLRNEPPVDTKTQVTSDQAYHDLVQPRVDAGKPSAPQAGIPITITKDIRQQLYDLGKTKTEVNAMKPEDAHAILAAGPVSDEQLGFWHEHANANFESGLAAYDLAANGSGPFDPGETKSEIEQVAGVPSSSPVSPSPEAPATNAPVPEVATGTPFAVDTSELSKRLDLVPGIHYSDETKAILESKQKWLNFTHAMQEARNVPELAGLASDYHVILTSAAGLHEFDALSAVPAVWVDRTVGAINGMNVRVGEAGEKINAFIGEDKEMNDRIAHALDIGNTDGLSPKEVTLANLMHQYWELTGDMAERVKMVKSALEMFLPHIVLKEFGGRDVVPGRAYNRSTTSAIQRVGDEKGNAFFPTLRHLEAELGEGSVETNLAKIFVAHGQGWNSALLYNNLIRKGISDLRLPKAGMDGHNVIIDTKTWKSLADKSTYRSIQAGPMKTGLAGYYVEKSMAERIDRLTPYTEMTGAAETVAKNINQLNSWFKEIKFIGPMHIWSMMSNMAGLTSKLGYLGLPPMLDPTTYKVIGRGAEIHSIPELYSRALVAGIPLPRAAEDMENSMGVLEKLPVVGKYFGWWHNFMWQKIGFHGMLGTWDYLVKNYSEAYAKKNQGVMPTGADLRAIDAYAAADARRALGFLTDLDMTKDYRLYSNSVFLASKWTTAQLRVFGDAFGVKFFSNLGGGERLPMGSIDAQKIGADKQVEMARRLMIGGWARLAMTALVMGGIGSTLMTGSPSTPVQNFMRDPMHTFDIYGGRDKATNQDRWIHMPIYMFQREFADWAMASVRAYQDGKGPIETTLAPAERFFSKANPILRTGLEFTMGREIGKWMNGYGDNSDIDNDKAIQNIHKSLDRMGIGLPTWASSLENRLIYAIRNISPLQAAFPTNPKAPVSGYDLATALGPGTYNVLDPRNAMALAGARIDNGIQYETNPQTGQEQSLSQGIQQSDQRKGQIAQMIDSVKAGDFKTADTIRQQLNLTPGQFKEYVTFGATHSTDQGIYATTPVQGVGLVHGAKLTNLFGTELNSAQQSQYFNMQSKREEAVLQMVMKDPGWAKMSSSEHQALGSQWLSYADKISAEQYGQAIGARPGQPLSDAQASKMITDAVLLEHNLTSALSRQSQYTTATPEVQARMMAERQAAAKSAVWQANLGKLKGLTVPQLQNMVNVQVGMKDQVTSYVQTLKGYQSSPDIYTRQQYLTKSMSWADLMVADAFAGKKFDNSLNAPLKPEQVWGVVKNGLALQDASLGMLHQSSVYTEASAVEQTALDNNYSTLAHRIALLDQRDNVDLSQQGSLYKNGFGQALQSRLMADEGYKQLVDSFGGKQVIDAHLKELNALKTQFAQEQGIPQVQLAKYNATIEAWYVAHNQQFGAFLATRKVWEQRDPVGQLFAAFNKSELAYAASADPLAQQLLDQQTSDATNTLPY